MLNSLYERVHENIYTRAFIFSIATLLRASYLTLTVRIDL